jgi:glyoxylase-like metal-dependent hydrolase (beta-lactamase superfamily II)
MRFAIGDVTVDVIVDDNDFELSLRGFLPGLDLEPLRDERSWLEPDFVDFARNVMRLSIKSFVLRLGGRTILVDACIGEHKDRPEIPAWNRRSGTGWLDRLRAVGVAPEAIDTVFCTHLHIDHVGWNTIGGDGRWRATFPNARYLVGRMEMDDWQERIAAGTAEPMHVRGLRDSVLPLVEAGLVDLVDDGYELAPGAVVTPLPGHTIGQMGLLLDRAEGRAVLCGDAIHSPVQLLQPLVSTSRCRDPALASRTRRALLEEAADTGRIVIPAHFRGRSGAWVASSGDSFLSTFVG